MRFQQQFRNAVKRIAGYPEKQLSGRHPYPAERDIIILYGIWNGWNASSISKHCGIQSAAVKRHIIRLQSNPGALFVLPILSTVMVGGKRAFRCEFCGDTQYEKDITQEAARLHVARHVTTEEYIQTFGVRGSGYHGM